MASMFRSEATVVRLPVPLVFVIALSACATKPASSGADGGDGTAVHHAAHGHAIATVERPGADSSMMLERVEDEDTHWVDLPHFGECPYESGEVPLYQPVDDAHVPGLNPERTRLTNMDAGDAVIHNEGLLVRLDNATADVLECLSVSACYDERVIEPGSIDLKFEVAPSGEVRGVDVEPMPALDRKGVRACARVAVWETTFPAFDGADMVVSYTLEID